MLIKLRICKRTRMVIFFLGVVSALASAQDAVTGLTLQAAVTLALKQNPSVQIANLQAAEAQEEKRIVRSGLLPQAQFVFIEDIQRFNIESIIGQRIPTVNQHVGPFQVINPGTQFSTPIFDLTLWRQYGAAKQRALAAKSDAQTAREETALLVVSQYLAVQRDGARVTAATSRRDLAQTLLTQAKALLDDGVATQIDVLRADVRLKQESQGLIQAEAEEKVAFFTLSRLLGIPVERGVALADQDQFSRPDVEDTEPTVAAALESRPELAAQSHLLAAAAQERALALAKSLPSLKFQGIWGQQASQFDGLIPEYNYQFNLNIPIFAGGALTAGRQRAALEEAKATQQVRDTRNRISEQVLTAREMLQAARSQVDVANQAFALTEQELTLARGRFQEGVTDNIEVGSAQDSMAQASERQIEALFFYNEARAQLSRAAGQVESTYTGAGR